MDFQPDFELPPPTPMPEEDLSCSSDSLGFAPFSPLPPTPSPEGKPTLSSPEERPNLSLPEPAIPLPASVKPVPQPKTPVSEPKTPVSESKTPVPEPKTPVTKPKTRVLPPLKRTVRTLQFTEIPKRTWRPIPCVSAQDARNRINRRKGLPSPDRCPVKRFKPNMPREIVPPIKSKAPVTKEQLPVSKERVPMTKECGPKEQLPVSKERAPIAKERVSCDFKEARNHRSFHRRHESDRSIHMHTKCVATLCITVEGYTITNGVKSISYDYGVDPQKLFEDLTALKVGHLFTTDTYTHQMWKQFQENLGAFHPMKELKVIHLDIKKHIQPCVYCSRYCHRWKAVMGGIVHLLHMAVDPIPHH